MKGCSITEWFEEFWVAWWIKVQHTEKNVREKSGPLKEKSSHKEESDGQAAYQAGDRGYLRCFAHCKPSWTRLSRSRSALETNIHKSYVTCILNLTRGQVRQDWTVLSEFIGRCLFLQPIWWQFSVLPLHLLFLVSDMTGSHCLGPSTMELVACY